MDLNAYFSVVSRLLNKGGEILIFEIHPIAYFLESGFDPKSPEYKTAFSYFNRGPYGYEYGLDYVGGVKYEAKECRWFMHKMSDILNAVLQSGIEITDIGEYNLEMANNPEVMTFDKLPLSYMLYGKKKYLT